MRLPWGLRWWELAPEALLGGALTTFLATETSAATSAFASTRAVTLMAGTAGAWVAARVVLVRSTPWPALRLAVFTAAAAGVVAVVVLPSYDDTTVVEVLSAGPAAPTSAPPVTTAASPAAAAPTAPAVAPAVPESAAAPPSAAPTSTAPPVPAPPPTAAAQPVALRSAGLRGIDHRAGGTAVLYRQADGSYVVGLEGIDIQPGPDYDLYLVPGADAGRPGGGLELGDLRGNKGTQYYPVPSGAEVATGGWTVLVWCETFDVPIANASLVG